MSAFLASVRDLTEARLAHRVGAQWIDLKEPRAGALGAVALDTIIEVRHWLDHRERRVSVSATIGDCWETPALMPQRVEQLSLAGIDYAKIGLFARAPTSALLRTIRKCVSIGPKIILVCFAEDPPTRIDMNAYADSGIAGAMLDTAGKSGPGLTGLLSIDALGEFVRIARGRKLLCGLAGSLRVRDIESLSVLDPDYLGFRGALCRNSLRESQFSYAAAMQVRDAMQACEKSRTETGVEAFASRMPSRQIN